MRMVPQKQQPTSKKQEAKRSKEGNNETIDKPCVEAAEKTSTEKNQTMNQAKNAKREKQNRRSKNDAHKNREDKHGKRAKKKAEKGEKRAK